MIFFGGKYLNAGGPVSCSRKPFSNFVFLQKLSRVPSTKKDLAKLEEIAIRPRRRLKSLAVMVLLWERVARKCRPDPTLLSPRWAAFRGPAPTWVRYRGGGTTSFQVTLTETKT